MKTELVQKQIMKYFENTATNKQCIYRPVPWHCLTVMFWPSEFISHNV